MATGAEDVPVGGVTGRILRCVDGLSAGLSIVSSCALMVIMGIVCFEVGSRYLFNSPTIWAWDINTQLMLLLVMLGLAEVYRTDQNVRVDVAAEYLPPRARIMIDLFLGVLVVFVAVIILWVGWGYFERSWSRGQRASSLFAPPIWPAKFLLPFGAGVLALQALAKMTRDVLRFTRCGKDGA